MRLCAVLRRSRSDTICIDSFRIYGTYLLLLGWISVARLPLPMVYIRVYAPAVMHYVNVVANACRFVPLRTKRRTGNLKRCKIEIHLLGQLLSNGLIDLTQYFRAIKAAWHKCNHQSNRYSITNSIVIYKLYVSIFGMAYLTLSIYLKS